VGLRAGLDTEARGKILYLYRGSNLDRPVIQSVVRHYADWASPPPKVQLSRDAMQKLRGRGNIASTQSGPRH
jgi:hypothetical protein